LRSGRPLFDGYVQPLRSRSGLGVPHDRGPYAVADNVREPDPETSGDSAVRPRAEERGDEREPAEGEAGPRDRHF